MSVFSWIWVYLGVFYSSNSTGGFNQMVIVEGGFCNLPSKLSPHAYKILYLKEGGKVYFSMHPLWSKCFQYAWPIKFPQPTTKQINSTLNTNWSKNVFQLRLHRRNKEIANEKKNTEIFLNQGKPSGGVGIPQRHRQHCNAHSLGPNQRGLNIIIHH